MITIKGKYNEAKVFADIIDDETKKQIQNLVNNPYSEGSKIRIMPDCHAGKGCVIGTTMTIKDKVVPNLVGVDIGCGMLTANLGNKKINLKKLDDFINSSIPSGFNVRKEALDSKVNLSNFACYKQALKNKEEYFKCSLGTLGGGNHFIEVDEDENKNKYLIIHSGSRALGLTIAKYYQSLADESMKKKIYNIYSPFDLVDKLIKENRKQDIQKELKKLKDKQAKARSNSDLAYLEGDDFNHYLHDMDICQKFALENRWNMAKAILDFLNIDINSIELYQTIHNYINFDDMILRKGSIAAYKGVKVTIPINMRDGTIIAIGKEDADYNFSAPHGAGRALSRRQAKDTISLEQFKNSMKGIYSTSVCKETIDESCFAYKSIDSIIKNIQETCQIVKIIKPIYNFKAHEEMDY